MKIWLSNILRPFTNSITPSFVTAIIAKSDHLTLLRTYKSRVEEPINYAIWEAARATTAAPIYFEPVNIKTRGRQTTTFINASLAANNPLKVVVQEALEYFGSNRKVQYILSLGTGRPGVIKKDLKSTYPLELSDKLKKLATDSIQAHIRYTSRFASYNYFRFNMEQDTENISLYN